MGYIYSITNKVNGYVYIGHTSNNPNYRWATHLSKFRRGIHTQILQEEYNRYGAKAFEFAIIEETNDLAARENYYIHQQEKCYNTNKPAGIPLTVPDTLRVLRTRQRHIMARLKNQE